MSRTTSFFCSTIGKKYLMGISAAVWTGFVFAHMAGNLLLFVSADAYNKYGHALTSGNIIYVAEATLIGALLLHVGLAISLTRQNASSRPQRYAVPASGSKAAPKASQTMAIHGTIILFFIIYHLITFKFGPHYETTVDGVVMRDLFKLMVEVFSQPLYVVGYVVCLILLGFHLSHGFGSVFQSFGLNHSGYQKKIKVLSCLYAVVVAAGFIAQPIYIFLFVK